jgi:putative endopeptidase
MRYKFSRSLTIFMIVFSICNVTFAQSSGFDPSRMDRSVEACDDFFQFSNGGWMKTTEIPASQSSWGSFNMLAESNRDVLHEILERAAKEKNPAGSNMQLIGDFYASCMDETAIEKAGLTPLQPYFAAIDTIRSSDDVKHEILELHKLGIPALFRLGGGPDAKDSNMVIINAGQGGITLPNRDYYLKDDARSTEIRNKFVEHMTNMFKLAGESADQAAADAKSVMEIESRLAKASTSPVELRDPDKNYNKISLTAAQEVIPGFPLSDYMKRRGFPSVTEINLGQPGYFKELNTMLTDVPADKWKTYFRWRVLSASAPALPKAFVDENFNFNGRVLSGTREQQPRWKRCVAATDQSLGEALGLEYAKLKFTPEQKARMDQLIDNLFAAMKMHIQNLTWMSDATKTKAIAKLAAYKRKIGYPEHPRGYKGLSISRDSYASNIMSLNAFQIMRNIADVGKPTDKTRMGMSAPTVNASYSPSSNDITFPAGILQPPFFNFKADDAINYGGIGAVIGHEISHGFDDQGSKYAANGNLDMWWTPEDRSKFEERAACVADQFSGYEVQPGMFINGRLTLGENIGDFGGLTIAYDALMKALEGKKQDKIDGFTPEQRFFLGWAQVWAGKYTPEAERLQVLGNPHALPRWRVNGPLSNMPQFQKAFGCKTGQKMVRDKFCEIW